MIDPPAPSTLVATIPRWLGRPPVAGEVILVGFSDYDDQRCVTIVLDPDRDPTDEIAALRQAVADGATDLAIVAYTGAESAALDLTLRFLATGAARWQLDVIGVLAIVPEQRDRLGYYRSLPDRTRYPLPTPARTEESR